jgi:colanic acid/amylovoran biosynthesis glycosyltransferase
MTVTVAYLINQYPKISHSFVRREILGLEACGVTVKRFAIRDCGSELVDERDRAELEKTCVLLKQGASAFAIALIKTVMTRPAQFGAALKLTLAVGRRSERGLLLNLVYLAEACVLLQRLQQTDVKQVHAHFGTNSTTVAMLCHALGGPPYSFTVHGPEEFDKVEAIALPEKIRRAKSVVAISSFGKSQLYRWSASENWSKIHVVHCGIDQEFQAPFIEIPDIPQLVCVGRLSEQKGHLLLLEAARILAQEQLSFKIVMVGDGELRPSIEALIDRYQLRSHIEITGWASGTEVKSHILSSRAFVLPSFAEGLPVVLMEALALGRPVITTYVAGIPELVESGVCGWLVPAGDVEGLAEAMRKALLASPEDLEQMGKTGMARVARSHDAVVEARKLAQLFVDKAPQTLICRSEYSSPV